MTHKMLQLKKTIKLRLNLSFFCCDYHFSLCFLYHLLESKGAKVTDDVVRGRLTEDYHDRRRYRCITCITVDICEFKRSNHI